MSIHIKNLFKQGATIVPRTFYFVELDQETPPDFKNRIINIKTPSAILKEAKNPWNTSYQGQIESEFIFVTALSKSILPYALFKTELVALPITVELNREKNRNEIILHSYQRLRSEGHLKAAKWFNDKENIWDVLKTEKNKTISSENYLNWQNKLNRSKN